MLTRAAFLLAILAFAASAFGVDPGRAEGTMTTDGKTITLSHAYLARKVHNDVSNHNDAVKIVLTDQALPAGTRIRDLDYTFPDGVTGVVVCIDRQQQPVHLVVQHPKGVYDGGWLELERDVTVKAKDANGLVEGHLRARKTEKASVTFAFDVDFAAKEE